MKQQEEINVLLQRYFDGATTLDEERLLQRYFTESPIDDALKVYRPLFTYFAQERAVQPPAPKTRVIRPAWSIITAMAASIAVLLWIGISQNKEVQNDGLIYIVDGKRVYDETAAIAIAENKLQMIAESMQTALNGMATLDKLQQSSQPLVKITNALMQIELNEE